MLRLLQQFFGSVATIALVLAGGCDSETPRSPQYVCVQEVLKAVERNDRAAFEQLATTRADMTIQRLGLNNLKAKQGYLGGVMRPEEWQRWRETFDRAREYHQAQALIQHSELSDVILLERGAEELILGGEFVYERYSLTATPKKSDRVPESVPVIVTLVPDIRGYKLLGLDFGSSVPPARTTGGTI